MQKYAVYGKAETSSLGASQDSSKGIGFLRFGKAD